MIKSNYHKVRLGVFPFWMEFQPHIEKTLIVKNGVDSLWSELLFAQQLWEDRVLAIPEIPNSESVFVDDSSESESDISEIDTPNILDMKAPTIAKEQDQKYATIIKRNHNMNKHQWILLHQEPSRGSRRNVLGGSKRNPTE